MQPKMKTDENTFEGIKTVAFLLTRLVSRFEKNTLPERSTSKHFEFDLISINNTVFLPEF